MSLATTLRHVFIPHHSNNHRAKALHIDALFTYILFFALLNLAIKTIHKTVPDILGYATDIHVEQLLAGTNAKRAENGLPALTLNGQLSAAAAAKASDMFSKNYWAHNSPTGSTPWEFISGAGYRYTIAGENLAKNFSTSGAVVDAWMASPTHKANIVKSGYRDVGFAVVNGTLNGEETTLVVQMFGSSGGGTVAKALPTAAPKPVELPKEAAKTIQVTPVPQSELAAVRPAVVSGYQGVTATPIINIPTFTRDIVIAFMAIMMGILALDAWVVTRRRVIRIAGHNIAHMLFIGVMYVIISGIERGSLL